eukprot:PhF_6_TR43654/c0_g1_i3/m.67083
MSHRRSNSALISTTKIVQTECSRLKVNTKGKVRSVHRRAESAKRHLIDAKDEARALRVKIQNQETTISNLEQLVAYRALQYIHAKLQFEIERNLNRELSQKLRVARGADYETQVHTNYDRTHIYEVEAIGYQEDNCIQEESKKLRQIQRDLERTKNKTEQSKMVES